MENQMYHNIINASIDYKVDKDVIVAGAVNITDKMYAVEVIEIFGSKVSWVLTPFPVIDIYKYFDKLFIEDVLSKLFCDGTWAYCQQHENLTPWMRNEAYDAICDELYTPIVKEYNLDWPVFFEKILRDMAEAGFLSKSIYYNIIAGYFERVTEHYFDIPINDVKYSTPDGKPCIKIEFPGELFINVSTKDFFTGQQFFNELTRETTTENFLNDIKHTVGATICHQNFT